MYFPRTRKIVLCIAAASLALSYGMPALAGQELALESVTSLDPNNLESNGGMASVVSADRIEGNPEDQLHLIGNAEVRRGGAILKGDRITYTQATDEVESVGNAHLYRLGTSFSGPSMKYRLTEKSGEMQEAEYEYAPRKLRGCAKNIRFLSGDTTDMEDVKVTTCPRDEEAWFIRLNKLSVDEYEQLATGQWATLHFLGVPIFTSPWFMFPIGNERRSGFLVPTLGMSSSRGIDIMTPYYFNIAPNYDLTLTPRVMTKRGAMLRTETRVLQEHFSAQLFYDYLPNDKVTDEDRSSTRLLARYNYGPWSANVDYNHVSDDDFISDFSGNIRESSVSILSQNFSVGYADSPYWNLRAEVRKNQTIRSGVIPYEKLPSLTFNSYIGNLGGFEITTYLNATRFAHQNLIEGDRFVAKTSVAYPLRGAAWFVTPKVSLLGRWYQLEDIDHYPRYTDKSPSNITPTLSVDSGLVFERQNASWFGKAATQTLEPRIFYTYTPYHNQDNMPVFDTWVADLNLTSLFEENAFTGYDRVSEANQISTALTTRYLDADTGVELFRASIGQRQYFNDQRVGFPSNYATQSDPTRIGVGRSDIFASMGARLANSLRADTTLQYSTSEERFMKAMAGIRWQPKPMSIIGLYYRFNDRTSVAADRIKQVDLALQWPLTERLFALARYNYSFYKKRPIEELIGFEYLHNCWTFRMVVQRYNTEYDTRETNFFLQLELNGLGSIGSNPDTVLSRNIQGYQAPSLVPDNFGQYDYYE